MNPSYIWCWGCSTRSNYMKNILSVTFGVLLCPFWGIWFLRKDLWKTRKRLKQLENGLDLSMGQNIEYWGVG